MIVECENCGTKFNVQSDRIKDEGSKVRCSNCKHVFMIFKPTPETAPVEKAVPGPPVVPETSPETGDGLDPGGDFGLDTTAGDEDLGFDDDLGLGDDLDDFGLDATEDGDAFEVDETPAVDDDLGLSDDFGDLDLGAPEAGDDLSPGNGFAADDDLSFMDGEDSMSEDLDGADLGAIDLGEEPSVSGADDDFSSGDNDDSFEETGETDSMDHFAEPSSDLVEDDELEDEDYPDDDSLLIGEDEEGLFGEDASASPKKGRGLLWFLVGLCFVLAAAGGVFFFAPDLLEPVLKPLGLGKVQTLNVKDDPMGIKFISPENAMHSFIKNEKEGQLLIITGQAKNHYPVPRSHIKVKGLLHNAKANVVAERQAYCGNILTKEELTTLPMDELMKRLSVKEGQKGANKNILPGQSVEFMVVFDKIPNDLAEYIVEIYSSEQGEPIK